MMWNDEEIKHEMMRIVMSFISNIESCEKASNSQDSITNLFIVKLLIIDNISVMTCFWLDEKLYPPLAPRLKRSMCEPSNYKLYLIERPI